MSHTSETLQAAFRYVFPAEVPALKELAQSLPPNPVVVNLGAGAGTSGLIFMESRPDLFLYTIDIQREDSPFGCLYAEEQVIKEAGYTYNDLHQFPFNRGYQLHGESGLIGKDWQSLQTSALYHNHRQVDMVFIDADHTYNGCKGDIEAWLPNIKPGGILTVHDYKKHLLTYDEMTCPHPMTWPGVDRAVDELLIGWYPVVMHVESLIAFRVNE
jgi:predicted O-methyltransferase YrrM